MKNKLSSVKSIISIVQKLVSATVVLGTFWVIPAEANTLNFDQIYLFGDSNSDQGNTANVSGFPPEPFFSQGRYTNGSNWVDYLSEDINLNPEIYTNLNPNSSSLPTDGINFTFGGATSGYVNLGGESLPGLQQQVDYFADVLNGEAANSEALYLIWVGPNDYVAAIDPAYGGNVDPTTIPTTAVNNFSTAISKLNELGANNILVFNEADVANTPLGSEQLTPEVSSFVSGLIAQQNTLLAQEVNQLNQANPELNAVTFDTEKLFQEILNNPSEFGLTNVTDNCSGINFPNLPDPAESYSPCSNPDEHLFWDNQHLTTAVHSAIADEVLVTLQSEFSDFVAGPQPANSSRIPEPSVIAALGLFSFSLLSKKNGKV